MLQLHVVRLHRPRAQLPAFVQGPVALKQEPCFGVPVVLTFEVSDRAKGKDFCLQFSGHHKKCQFSSGD